MIFNYLLEFDALWNLSKADIRLLTNPVRCNKCERPIFNILLMNQEDYYRTKVDVLQQCLCTQKIVHTDYYDASLYNNYFGTIQQFEEDIIAVQQSGDEIAYHQLVAQQDFVVANYLSMFRENRMGMPIIHAVGIKIWKWFNKHEGAYVYKIIWKERGANIRDECEIIE